MSTRNSIVYLEDIDVHVFTDVLDEEGHIYFEGVVQAGSSLTVDGGVHLAFKSEDFKRMCREFVAELDQRAATLAAYKAKQRACGEQPSGHVWSRPFEWLSEACARCGLKRPEEGE